MDIDATVVAANDYLQKSYINSRYSRMIDEWPPYQPKHYTTLALIHHQNKCTNATVISVTQELAVAGKFQPNVDFSSHNSISQAPNIYSNTSKKISDIFVSVTARDAHTINPSIILIEGAPGIGKTVLAKEIAFQWASNKLLSEKKILLLLFLRQCNFKIIKTFKHLVEYVVKSDKIPSCLAEHLLQTEGKDLAIVFDGYDEISEEDRKSSIIADILCHRILAKSCIVITSRPTASADLHDTVNCRVEIVGFTEEDRLDYIETALQGDDDKIKILKLYLQSNPTINALCYIPLNMTILLCLVEVGTDALPKTQTDMYKQLINMTILRFVRKYNKKFAPYIASISTLPYPHNRVYEDLTKLAYKALRIDKIVFTMNEIEKICPNLTMNSSNWNGLGLLKAVRCFDFKEGCDQVTFHFLHFSVQEYMAAFYISTLSNNKQVKLLKKTFWQHRFYNTWVMYVGITCGNSFALKHFLSGNWLQFRTKFFKCSSISNKYLKHKIKCLHLFQCLIESSNEDVTASVSQSFQDNKIDLSNQTLLASDVNMLGFSLIRSINKQWDMLNLHGCNIGSIGSKILCDTFLNNNSRHMITIRKINFSHNHLNVSSLAQLFELFRSWHTSEIIITDNDTLKDNPSNELYAIIEDAFFLCEHNTQIKLQFGPFYFAHGINNVNYRYNRDLKNLYLLNCVCEWKSTDRGYFTTNEYSSIYWINSSVPNDFIEGACSSLLDDAARNTITSNSRENNLFIYNPDLSDEFANKMGHLISNTTSIFYGVMLIISKSEVQGIINTVTLSNRLSKSALLNLIKKCRTMCYTNMQTNSWKQDLCCNGSISDLIIYTFIELLYKIACSHCKCNLRIALREKDVVIAHNTDYNVLKCLLPANESTRAVYISNCDIPSAEYETLCHHAETLYICNGHVTEYFFKTISSAQKVFVHNLTDINPNDLIFDYYLQKCSVLFVTKNILIAYEPTCEQLALALQLKPSVKILKLHIYQGNHDAFNQILTILDTNMSELDFTNSFVGGIECDILYQYLKMKKHSITVNTLKISLENLPISILPKFTRLLLMLKVKYLIFNGINHDFYKCFMKNICTKRITSWRKLFLSVTYNDKQAFLFYNSYNKKVTILLKDVVMYFVDCNLSSRNNENIAELNCIFHNFINQTLHKDIHQSKIFCISCNARIQELDITDYDLQLKGAIMVFKALQGISTLNKLSINKNNITEKASSDVAALISCNTQLQELDISDNLLQSTGVITILKALEGISTLTKLFISKNYITENAASDVATLISCNTQLQELDISDNLLQSTGVITILNTLEGISTLTKLFISKNCITENAAIYIAALISCNTQLQELDISDNYLQSTGVITISKALQGISTLTKLCINNNNINSNAANDIATAISYNNQLRELNISGNNLQTTGTIIILKTLRYISTVIKLNISKNNITQKAADDIAAVISCSTQLQELDISDNNLQTIGGMKILKALKNTSTVKKLFISKNYITDKAANEIAAVISCNTQLQELDISDNYLQTTGAVPISKALPDTSNLNKLYIGKSKSSDRTANNAVDTISCSIEFQKFHVTKNDLQSTGTVKVLKALQGISTLKRLFINKSNITEKAASDVATLISCNTQLQELDISDNHIQSTGVITISKALQGISTLTKLCISKNNITAKAANNIATAISRNLQLQEFDVSNNDLHSEGIKTIVKALQDISTLIKLNISKNNFTYIIADYLAMAISSNNQLQELNISGNNLQTTGAIIILKTLQNIPTVTKFNISMNNITQKAADDLAAVISFNTRLQELDISDNNLQTTGAIKILKALQNITTLTKLFISNNCITDKVADEIAAVISCNTQLQELDISNNYLQNKGVVIILKALQNICTLTKLNISKNNFTFTVADDLANFIFHNIQLQELNISDNDFQASGAVIISYALQNTFTLKKFCISKNNISNKAADNIATAISRNYQLQELNISGNYLKTTGATSILKTLQSISTVIKLNISMNYITQKAADDIAAVISCSTQLQELDISGNELQTTGIIKILKALQNTSTLTKLINSKNCITDKAADEIAAVISCNSQLQELDISDNNLQATGTIAILKALQHISTLTKLYIHKNNINYKAADIAAVISCNTQLQKLDISDSNLQPTDGIKVLTALQNISTLTKLFIGNNYITNRAADNIAAVISCNTHLEKLDISSNHLQTTGIITILKALQNISTLRNLYIGKNDITDIAADDIAAVISCNMKLKELDISDNNLQTTGAITISKALQHISTLTKLYIRKNKINNKAADDIAIAIFCNTQLQELDISDNNLQSTGAIRILETLKYTPTLRKFYISKNNICNKTGYDIATFNSQRTQLQHFDIYVDEFTYPDKAKQRVPLTVPLTRVI